jgi:Domain of unknown function (DUF5134)
MGRLTPLWLGDLLAAVMIATAVYCASRVVYARIRNRATHRDVDGLHVLMGVAMAGMLTTHLTALTPMHGGLHAVWVALFALGTAWFGYRAVRDRGRASAHEHRALIHLVGSAAMLYMLLAAGSGGMPGMGASGGSARLPEVGLLLGLAATGASVLILDRLGSLTVAVASAGVPAGPSGATGPVARRVLAPRAAECCHLAMCVTTAYMLLAMFT